MPYTEVAISSYNATPPTDDGADTAANTITWAGIKTKLGDPLNTAIASLDDNVASACGAIDSNITSLEARITAADGDITAEDGVLSAPSGTELFFVQTAAPTSWTKSSTHNDKALRLVSGTVSTGGSTAFTSVFASRTITDTELPAHGSSHSITVTNQSVSLTRTSWTNSVSESSGNMTSGGNGRPRDVSVDTGIFAATVTHSGTTGSAGSGSAMDFAVQYVDIILAVKD